MDDPLKIIHKYKNNNGRIQYHIHIFIGNILSDSCMKILQKIKDLDLYASLTSLSEREINIIVKNYGEFWYEKFFNGYHIINTIKNTLNNPSKMKELNSIYGSEWVSKHFVNYQERFETIEYSYEYSIKEEKERRMIRKIMQKKKDEAEDIVDYTTIGQGNETFARITNNYDDQLFDSDSEDSDHKSIANSIDQLGSDTDSDDEVIEFDSESVQVGGQEEEVGFDSAAGPDFDFEGVENEKDVKDFEEQVEEDLESADVVFGELDDLDENSKLTTREIKKAISEKAYEKISQKISDFDTSQDNSMFDEDLKNVYDKNYIINQYIYKDDTIKTIHGKICCGFKNNDKFGEDTYIIPQHQYLWSEYQLKGKIEKVMIGQKWVVKNDIVKLDVEPNPNLRVYEDLRGNLKKLRDTIKRQGKIKREDDDNNILYDYKGYFTFNELYLIDIFNELGIDFDPNFEELKNLMDVYIRIYFPKIRPEDMKNIIDFLGRNTPENVKAIERSKLKNTFESINNDLILENEIMRDIELVKKNDKKEYTKIFKENFVTQ